MKHRIKRMIRGAAAPVGTGIARLGIPANAVTIAGALAAAGAAWGFYTGSGATAFWFLLASGLCDLLDGAVARARRSGGTPFGAALDSTLDRYGEGFVLGAILARLAATGEPLLLQSTALLALIGSFLVSYVRARAEGLGIACEVGVLERPERLFLLLALALWGPGGMPWILGALAILSHVTFVQRLLHIRRAGERQSAIPAAHR